MVGTLTLKRTIMFYQFLFPRQFRGKGVSLLILLLRLVLGVMIFRHGLVKLYNFEQLSFTFPDVFGLGSYTSLMLVIMIEFSCSLFLMFGLLIRLSVIPLIISLGVAFFDVHNAQLPEGELSLVYLVISLILYFTGPGRYSLDYLIDRRVEKDEESDEQALPK